jgi:hypothetical protein
MARPEKHTVDYFPFYAKDGKTLFILESRYGCKGTGFFTNVLRFLCLTPNHHYCVSGGRNAVTGGGNSDRLYFFSKVHCDEESGMDMLNIMSDTGKINRDLWYNHRIIFSEDLIESISDAYRKRENSPPKLDQIRKFYKLPAEETQLPAEETRRNEVSSVDNTQRKEKERKEKKIIMPKPYSDDFLFFWGAYPSKVGKAPAWLSWEKLFENGALPDIEKIITAIEKQKNTTKWTKDDGQYIPNPTTWLNQRRWEDEVETISGIRRKAACEL